jgi:error-prone DNA polymerase
MNYAELRCKTNFSFQRGASHPDELVRQAKDLGYSALAITDLHSLSGVVAANTAAKASAMKIVIGAEVHPIDGPPIVLWAPTKAAYSDLCRLISRGRLTAAKGECRLTLADVGDHSRHLLAGVPLAPLLKPKALPKPQAFEKAPTTPGLEFIEPGNIRGDEEECGVERGHRPEGARDQSPGSSAAGAPWVTNGQRSPNPEGVASAVAPLQGAECERPGTQGGAAKRRLPWALGSNPFGVSDTQRLNAPLTPDPSPTRGEGRRTRGEGRNGATRHHLRIVREPLAVYRDMFGERCYGLAELSRGPCDEMLLEAMIELAARHRIPVAAANDVLYHDSSRQLLHEVLTAIRLGCTVAELGDERHPNAERRLQSIEEMADRFRSFPEALDRAHEIASRCSFTLDELKYQYPAEACPAEMSPSEYLAKLSWNGAKKRWPDGMPEKVRRTLEHELQLIKDLAYEPYFLTVWDVTRFARSQGILCQGRGSAANSAVCYCLGVTEVDPERIDLLVERFISRERNEAPDIDIDFEHERRDEVLQYIYRKYGRDRAALTAINTCYRPRSALRDVGKALGLSLDRVDALAKQVDWYDASEIDQRTEAAGFDVKSDVGAQCIELVHTLMGFPRHASQHPGGMVISQVPIHELAPLENARMENRTIIAWDKYDLDALGILKVDCLGLGMLTMLRKCFGFIRQHWGRQMSLSTIPHDDPAVYEMLQNGDAIGTFQVESRAQLTMLPRLKPACFFDLVVEVAIVRPGPIQGQMVHPYLRRREGKETVTYPTPGLEEILKPTLGVPLFQEQVMKVAMEAAGFSAGEADELRRAMAAWGRSSKLKEFKAKLLAGMKERGLSDEFAERLYKQIEGFAGYGFPLSHAASFANLVYASSWCKKYYHVAFTAALLNAQPMGFYAPAQLIYDARAHGVEVLPPDVNCSDWDCTLEEFGVQSSELGVGREERGSRIEDRGEQETPLPAAGGGRRFAAGGGPALEELNGREPPSSNSVLATRNSQLSYALRIGLRLVKSLGEEAGKRIEEARRVRPFDSLADLSDRAKLTKADLAALADADAYASLSMERRTGYWVALAGPPTPSEMLRPADVATPEHIPPLDPLTEWEHVQRDYATIGLSLRAHPFSFLREELTMDGIASTKDFRDTQAGRRLTIGGLVLFRQRPETAKGTCFITLEDEFGCANLIVRPNIWEAHRRFARNAAALSASGWVERQGKVVHLMVQTLADLTSELAHIKSKARDFR